MQCKAATYILRRRITFLRIWIMVVLRIPLCIIVRRMDRYEPTLSVAALWCMSRKGGMLQVDLIVVKAQQHTHQLLFWVFWLLNIIGKSRNNTKQTADCQSFWFPQCFATGKESFTTRTFSVYLLICPVVSRQMAFPLPGCTQHCCMNARFFYPALSLSLLLYSILIHFFRALAAAAIVNSRAAVVLTCKLNAYFCFRFQVRYFNKPLAFGSMGHPCH